MNPSDAEFERWERSLTPKDKKDYSDYMNSFNPALVEVEHE